MEQRTGGVGQRTGGVGQMTGGVGQRADAATPTAVSHDSHGAARVAGVQ